MTTQGSPSKEERALCTPSSSRSALEKEENSSFSKFSSAKKLINADVVGSDCKPFRSLGECGCGQQRMRCVQRGNRGSEKILVID